MILTGIQVLGVMASIFASAITATWFLSNRISDIKSGLGERVAKIEVAQEDTERRVGTLEHQVFHQKTNGAAL